MSSRQKELKKLYKKLKKRYPDDSVVWSRDRKLLEHLVFAVFLENAKREVARDAFDAMERYYIDWNEIRVSTANEIADVVGMTPDAQRVGERLRRLLQWIFDATYKFDLEDLRAKGREAVVEFLKTVPFSTAFMNDYAALFGCGEGTLPLSEGALRALRLLDFVVVSADGREIAPELDGAFEGDEALDFFYALHELGVEMLDDELRPDAIKFLRSLDAAVDERSWKPFVEPTGPTDPREIARLVVKQEKRQKRASTSLIDEIDMLDDAIESDDLDGDDDLLAKDVDDEYGEAFGSETARSDDDSVFGVPKKRARKGPGRDGAVGDEASTPRDDAPFSDFYGSDDGDLFAFEEPLENDDEKPVVAKPKRKRRGDEPVPADGEFENAADEETPTVKTRKKRAVDGDSDAKAEKKETKKSAKKSSAKKETKSGSDAAGGSDGEVVGKPKTRAKRGANKDEPSGDAPSSANGDR